MSDPSTPRIRERSERRAGRHSFVDTVIAMTELAPTFPPMLVSHGLELGHAIRRLVGDRPVEASRWEELLALRRGPGADVFVFRPGHGDDEIRRFSQGLDQIEFRGRVNGFDELTISQDRKSVV